MSTPRPKLFIGSSKESKAVGDALHARLEEVAEVTVWDQAFTLSDVTLDRLRDQLGSSDFAAFIFAPDDITTSRGTTEAMPRDNVILETGMALGLLGRERTFVVRPRTVKVKVPSDFLGITTATYDDARADGHLPSAVGPTAAKIVEVISRLGIRQRTAPLPATPSAGPIGIIVGFASDRIHSDEALLTVVGSKGVPVAHKVLEFFSEYSGRGWHPAVIAREIEESALRTEHVLERLSKADYVEVVYNDEGACYWLAANGREYIVQHDMDS